MSHARDLLSRAERGGGSQIRTLATVMALPLVDGVFAALVLAGVLGTVGSILQVGLLVFTGSAAVAVILTEMDGRPRETVPSIAAFGVGLVLLAGLEAALAPTFREVVDLAIFERFAALVILAIAASTASARIDDVLPRPSVIVGLGLVASLDVTGASLVIDVDPDLVLRGAAAAGVGTAFAIGLAALAPTLRGLVDVERFRFGSAVALGTLPFAILGYLPGNAPLVALAVAGVLAFDPDGLAREARSAGERLTAASRTSGDDDDAEERAPWL